MFSLLVAFTSMTCCSAPAAPGPGAAADTIYLEVGAKEVDGRIFKPHAARVRVYNGAGVQTAEWINELTLGDSAGRPVMRWLTKGVPVASNPQRPISEILQTYDAVTLAPYGYRLTSSSGADIRLALDGRRVRGTRRTPADTMTRVVDDTLDRPGFVAGASDLVPVAAGLRTGSVLVAPVWGPNMRASEYRIFTVLGDTVVDVEGTPQRSRKVEERRRAGGALLAVWYLTLDTPYMVYGEVPLPDGTTQRMTEVSVPMGTRK